MHKSIKARIPTAIEQTSAVIAAYVSRNFLPANSLAGLIGRVHEAFETMQAPPSIGPDAVPHRPTRAEIAASVQKSHIVSFINGKRYKTLKRHLSAHGFSSFSYRERYGLPFDYPMVAPGYAERRSLTTRRIMRGVETA